MSSTSASPAPPSSPSEQPYVTRALDPKRVAAVNKMCRSDRPDACVRIAGAFLNDVDGKLAVLVAAIEKEDYREVARLTHYLKGSADIIGATGLAALLADLDSEARMGRTHVAAAARLDAVARRACELVATTFELV